MRRIMLPAVVLASIFIGDRAAQAQQPGDRVIVVEQTDLKAGREALETLPRGLPLAVSQVDGDWLAVANRRSGWVHRKHVRTLPEAIEYFSAAIARNDQDGAVYVIRGVLWQNSGDHDRAIADFTAALRLDPKNRFAYSNRAIAWKKKGQYELALGDYNEAIRLDPHSAMTWHNRGAVWVAQGEYARAADDFAEAIRLDPELPDGYNALAWLQATCSDPAFRNGPKALENAVRACELSGYRRWQFLGTLAAANAEAGNFQAAIEWDRRSLELAPTDQRGELLERLQLFQAGLAYREPRPVQRPGVTR